MAASISFSCILPFTGCTRVAAREQPAAGQPAITTVTIGNDVLVPDVKRFGINLSGQNFYDSGQMLRNLVFRNPGFEGETWQSILRCKTVTPNTCTDEHPYATWPAGFLTGARFEFLSGPAKGQTGSILASSAAHDPIGVTLKLPHLPHGPAAGDFILVRAEKPGGAEAGWWTSLNGGAKLATEFHDLAPNTEGKQALRIDAVTPGATAEVSSFFDSLEGHSFVQLHGPYTLQFRAKPLTGTTVLSIRLERMDKAHGLHRFFDQAVALQPGWHDYRFTFPTAEDGSAIGTVGLTFRLEHASALLDDVALTPATHSPINPTAFRDEVVQTLRALHPGVLRSMDNGTNFGSSLANMLAPPFARERAGSSTQATVMEDIAIGLKEFLGLCQAIGAEPWYTLPPGTSPAEARALIEYLARPAPGQPKLWTEIFPVIHLELGNEQWNSGSFAGSTLSDPAVYGGRASEVFAAARSSPAFDRARFDLILGSWNGVPWWTSQELAHTTGEDTVAIAPYLFDEFNDASSAEAVFGPMFAEPEQLDSWPTGLVAQQAALTRTARSPVRLAVYEVNLGTMSGSVGQAALDSTVPSLGAGLAVADHMLLMLRDGHVTTQTLFALPEFRNDFASTGAGAGGEKMTIPLWGAVVDMGGATGRRRPQFLALQLINAAMLPQLVRTTVNGPDPTWNQPLSANDKVELTGAHLLQSFAFADGPRRSLILLNLSRASTLPVVFAGPHAPAGRITESVLTAAHITDSNERELLVQPRTRILPGFSPATPYTLPPFSLTTLTWNENQTGQR